jgi:hypothetical protein
MGQNHLTCWSYEIHRHRYSDLFRLLLRSHNEASTLRHKGTCKHKHTYRLYNIENKISNVMILEFLCLFLSDEYRHSVSKRLCTLFRAFAMAHFKHYSVKRELELKLLQRYSWIKLCVCFG